MAARPSWRGYLKLSLVSCAVELYPASSGTEKITFHILNRETGNRVRQRLVDEKTQEEVAREDRVKGYEIGKRKFILVEEGELEAIEIESTRTMELESFVAADEMDPVYFDSAHYLVPEDKVAEEAFAVIREAMRLKKMAGIARVVMRQRERILMLEPRGNGILAITLRYGYEVRPDGPYFDKISQRKIPPEMIEIASDIIDRKITKFDPRKYEDRYENALLKLLNAKMKGRPVSQKKIATPKASGNLLEALKKSLAGDAGARRRTATTVRPAARRATHSAGARKPAKRRA